MTSRLVSAGDSADTRLGRTIAPLTLAHPGKSGIVPLARGLDAFAARAALADAAVRSLDIQHYIWHDDVSGGLLFDALRRAADRGVRVRLLLDDNNTAGMDPVLAELVSHRNLEVRLFNPFRMRAWRALGYVTDFSRLNRRMHNKTFTADNQVTIIGGRNIGDEYLGGSNEVQFVDLDVMAIGRVVQEVTQDFERYWSCRSAYPAERLLPAAGRTTSPRHAAPADTRRTAAVFLEVLARQPFVRELLEERLQFEWADVRMVSDDPSKGEGRAKPDELLWSRLIRMMKPPAHELELVSAYFVPGEGGVDQFVQMARRGVKVAILTNSLEATDVAAVHAGYAKRRKPLLEAGVTLFELKRTATLARPRSHGPGGSSDSSLHAKTFEVDRSLAFVGSFNFDPRSARLNTELGFLIESSTLAATLAAAINGELAERSYQVRLGTAGRPEWVDQVDGKEVVYDREPGAGFWRRLTVAMLSLLPIEWLL
jgi:cardiolipin synthase C